MLRSTLCSCLALGVGAGLASGQTAGETATQQSADTLSLDLVSVSALRPQGQADITASVATLDASDLAVRDAPFLSDQLRAVPGLAISRNGSAGSLNQIRIRGGEANHTLVLLDGIEVSDPVSGETDFGVFSGANAQYVEIARGEQSALFGSDAIGGVINVRTVPEAGFRGLAEAGSRSTHRLEAGHGWTFDQGSLSAAFSDTASDGVDTSGLGSEDDGYRNTSALINGVAAIGADWTLSGLARYGKSDVDFDSDTDFDGVLNDSDNETEAEQWTFGGALQGDALGFNHVFRASYAQVTRDNFADGAIADTAEGERTKFAYSPSVNLATSLANLTISGLIDHETEDYSVRDTAFGGGTDQDQSFETLGIAGEVLAKRGPISLNASARYDDNDGQFEDAETWRIGGAYAFDFGGRVRGSFGTGVKNPTFTELFGFFPSSFVGNPDLNPEKSTSWEIGWDQTYDRGQWSLTYFDAELEDEIFTDFSVFPNTAANRDGESDRSGVEFAANWQASEAFALSGAVSNITSQDDTGTDEVRVPEWTASFAVGWESQVKDGLRAGFALDYVGEQFDNDFSTFPSRTVTLDAYTLVSASVDYPLTERISLTLRGDNLLDEDAVDVFGYNGPGAGVFAGIRIR